MRPSRPCALALLSLLFQFAVLPVQAHAQQQRILVEVVPYPGPRPSPLSPELLATVLLQGTFLGIDREGRAVIELPLGMGLTADVRRTLATVRGVRSVRALGNVLFEAVEKLVVLHPANTPPTEFGGFDEVVTDRTDHFTTVTPPRGGSFGAPLLAALAQQANVLVVEPNYRYWLTVQEPDDPGYPKQWGLDSIGAAAAWDTRTGAGDLVVAVLDTGVWADHPDLKGHVGTGVNFVEGAEDTDVDGHGTQCAGIIAALGDNNTGVTGVVWSDVEIQPLKIFRDRNSSAKVDDIARAMDYARKNNAKILSASFSGPNYSEAVDEAVSRLEDDGILLICAAGNGDSSGTGQDNDTKPQYPASLPFDNVITVLAVTPIGDLAGFSNYGKLSTDIAAPGTDILTTDLSGTVLGVGTGYGYVQGTSMAVPFVAGAAAITWAERGVGKPYRDIKTELLNKGRKVAGVSGRCISERTLSIAFLGPAIAAPGLDPEPEGGVDAESRARAVRAEREGLERSRRAGESGSVARDFTGELIHPAFAIGGETTGTHLDTGDGELQLDMSGVRNADTLLRRLAGKRVVVTGSVRVVRGVEVTRRIVKVQKIRARTRRRVF